MNEKKESLKVYILARKDAPIGKILAHVGHASCRIMEDAFDFEKIREWYFDNSQTKIILSVKDEKTLKKYLYNIMGKIGCEKVRTCIDIHDGHMYCLSIHPLTDIEAKELGLKRLRLYE